LDSPAVVAHARVVIVGNDGHKLHEEIITAGGFLREGRFSRMNVGQISQALSSQSDELPNKTVLSKLTELWPKHLDALKSSLEVRMSDLHNGMQNLLKQRAQKEISDIKAIMEELSRAIEAELGHPDYSQLYLPGLVPSEREQYDRNISNLRARLQQIPLEIEAETNLIIKRFENPQARLFPVAITYLVPERYANG
jgi:hypothetical protein